MKGDQMEALSANPTPRKLQISNWTRFSPSWHEISGSVIDYLDLTDKDDGQFAQGQAGADAYHLSARTRQNRPLTVQVELDVSPPLKPGPFSTVSVPQGRTKRTG